MILFLILPLFALFGSAGVDMSEVTRRLLPELQDINDGIYIYLAHLISEHNPRGAVFLQGGILVSTGDMPGWICSF